MIRCFLLQPALRRHLNEGEPLSESTRAHLSACAECRGIVEEHRVVIARLKAPAEVEAPFLRAHIMNSIRSPATRRPTWKPVWLFATIIAMTVIASKSVCPRSTVKQ